MALLGVGNKFVELGKQHRQQVNRGNGGGVPISHQGTPLTIRATDLLLLALADLDPKVLFPLIVSAREGDKKATSRLQQYQTPLELPDSMPGTFPYQLIQQMCPADIGAFSGAPNFETPGGIGDIRVAMIFDAATYSGYREGSVFPGCVGWPSSNVRITNPWPTVFTFDIQTVAKYVRDGQLMRMPVDIPAKILPDGIMLQWEGAEPEKLRVDGQVSRIWLVPEREGRPINPIEENPLDKFAQDLLAYPTPPAGQVYAQIQNLSMAGTVWLLLQHLIDNCYLLHDPEIARR